MHNTKPVFTAQFHPEAKGGPTDTEVPQHCQSIVKSLIFLFFMAECPLLIMLCWILHRDSYMTALHSGVQMISLKTSQCTWALSSIIFHSSCLMRSSLW